VTIRFDRCAMLDRMLVSDCNAYQTRWSLQNLSSCGVSTPGHLNAMTTLTRKIKDRGHDVLFSSRICNLAHHALKTLAYTMINLRQYGLHCSRARYLCLHSPAHRAAIAIVRAMQKPLRNDKHLRIARLVPATHPLS
jgi:hypothetical protein